METAWHTYDLLVCSLLDRLAATIGFGEDWTGSLSKAYSCVPGCVSPGISRDVPAKPMAHFVCAGAKKRGAKLW